MATFSRRTFLRSTTAAVAGALAAPYILRAAGANEQKLRLAFIGTGGKGGSHLDMIKEGMCVCYADVDKKQWAKISKAAPDSKAYTDWRQMFDKHEKEIDAVVVATPDHTHAYASMRAIKAGKHVYCEKPLTWSIDEARKLATAAAAAKVATQMGNQGHANMANRMVVQWIRDGAVGDVKEIHTWTDRPGRRWPQGLAQRPEKEQPPEDLNWDVWLGPAPYREYHPGLHQRSWRGWFDFGCGAVGDMGCHTWEGPYWAMNPDYPIYVELLEIGGKGTETFPLSSHFKWVYPAKGNRPGFEAHWYSGGLKPEVPEEYANDPVRQDRSGKKPSLPGAGSIYIGTKGKMISFGDYGGTPRLIPETAQKAFKVPELKIPLSIGHKLEWLKACKGEAAWDSPGSNFMYAGPLTEAMLLGAMVERVGEKGAKIECDPVKREIKTKAALAMAHREPRKGWTL